ncbi:MAG TPA: GPW/gp25 family protein [Flavobacterium sp.]|jgi:phage baseplate assembly protein W
MKGVFYKLPLDFGAITKKEDLEKTSLEHSIAQQIILLATTSFGECKFNETFGCVIWETDFDLLMNENTFKDIISKNLKQGIRLHEHRITVNEIKIKVSETRTTVNYKITIKKRVDIVLNAIVKSTNRSFDFNAFFYVGPLSFN